MIEERGWNNIVHATNQMPEVNGYVPVPVPRDHPPPPVPPNFSNQNRSLYGQVPLSSPLSMDGTFPGKSASSEVHRPDLHAPRNPTRRPRAMPVSTDAELEEQEALKATRPEVRFTLPRVQPMFGTAETAKAAQPSPTKPDLPPLTKTDNEILKVRQKLDHLREKKEAASKAADHSMVTDITYYAIPDLVAQLDKLLLQQQREDKETEKTEKDKEKEKTKNKPAAAAAAAAAHTPQIKKDRSRSYHTEIETESEHDEAADDSDGQKAGSKVEDIYD